MTARDSLGGIIAILRLTDSRQALPVAHALVEGGIGALEIALTTPQALVAVTQVADALGEQALVGAGSVVTRADAHDAITAGARFLVTPAVRSEVLAEATRRDIPVVCGAATPTEALAALDGGATLVKIFPARELGGPGYIKALRAPLPHLPLVPTGGVRLEDVVAYRKAGALALGIGSPLLPPSTLRPIDPDAITANARRFTQEWRTA